MKLLATAYLKEKSVCAFVSEEEKILVEGNPEYQIMLPDWDGYCNDYYLKGKEFTFILIPEHDYKVLSRYTNLIICNEDVISSFISYLRLSIETKQLEKEVTTAMHEAHYEQH